jgi:hypothetical protein
MWLKFNQFKASLDITENKIKDSLAAHLQLPSSRIFNFTIQHKSLDARHKNEIFFVYNPSTFHHMYFIFQELFLINQIVIVQS